MTLSYLSSDYIQSARFGSLSPYVKPYITLVLNKGYKPSTILNQLRLIARLNRWLLRTDFDLGGLDERVLVAKTHPVKSALHRYRPGDRLLNFLSSLVKFQQKVPNATWDLA